MLYRVFLLRRPIFPGAVLICVEFIYVRMFTSVTAEYIPYQHAHSCTTFCIALLLFLQVEYIAVLNVYVYLIKRHVDLGDKFMF